MGDVRNLLVDVQNSDAGGEKFGNFLQKLSDHVRGDIARGGTDVDMIGSRIRATASELEELAYELGVARPVPPPLRLVVASPTVHQPMIGGWGAPQLQASTAPAVKPQLPPHSLPRTAADERDQPNEPPAGENPIQDLHRRALYGH